MDRVIIEERMPKRTRKGLSLEKKQSFYGYLFCLPIIIGFAFMYIPVIVQSIIYSFSTVSFSGSENVFVGIQNYKDVLAENGGEFLRIVLYSTMSLLPQIVVILIFAFFMANVLNQNFRGRTISRVIFFIPVIMSTGIISYFDKMSSMVDVYSSQSKLDMGSSSNGLSSLNFSGIKQVIGGALNNPDLTNIVFGAVEGIYGVITSAGVQMLIFLSGLQSISSNMYEAAKVEGASGWEVFWKISFPMISPLILVNLLYTVIDLFLKSDNAAIAYINTALESSSQYGPASALSWIYTIVVLAFVAISFLVIKKLVVYQD